MDIVDSTPVYTLTVLQFRELTKSLVLECLEGLKPNQDSTLPRYRTRKEVSEILGLSYPTMDRYDKRGILKKSWVGRRVLYSEESIKDAVRILNKQDGKDC